MSERLTMRKIREILRLTFECGRSQREIASSLSVSVGSIAGYLKRTRAAGLTWEIAQTLTDNEVEALVYHYDNPKQTSRRAPIDFAHVHHELHRSTATLELLWVEYQQAVIAHSEGLRPYQYSQFCGLYMEWARRLKPSMRCIHRAGEKVFIDYSGKKPALVDSITGEIREVELFVMVLGASSYTYAEATHTQALRDFVGSNIRGFEYFGGVPEVAVPDQLRSAVKGPDRYEPDINPTYLEMAQHYGITVMPTRPRKPRDKAKVEGAVLIIQRWILAKLRHRTFFSLDELNAAIWELLEEVNTRPFQKLEGCRQSAFFELDKPALRPLPATRYELAERRWAGVKIDYHIEFDKRYYSVPYRHVNQRVEVRATDATVEILLDGERIASHKRSYGARGTYVTDSSHQPENHRHQIWPPERLISWGAKHGPSVARIIELTLQ
jgi:transposase